jgi:nucleoside-diphosphate-sugar epimerase
MSRSIRNCNVCVVGGAGFLGSHLVNHLIDDRGCKVLVIDNLVTGRLEFIHPDATFEHYDITTSEYYLHRLFEHRKIQYVFNYAAQPYIPLSFDRPIHVLNTNAFGAMKVINAAEEAGCKGILQVSSAEIYGDQSGMIAEDAPVTPHSSYGASKAAIDFLVQVRWREGKTPVIAMRQFNCVGERETHPYVVPEIISQLTEAPVVRLGNNSTRDFQYAGDAVRMAVCLLESGEFGEVYNMGSQDAIAIYDLARLIGEMMWETTPVHVVTDENRKRPWEIWHLQSDNTKLYGAIAERPAVSLTEALKRTIAYFHANNNKWGWERGSL